MTESYHQIPHWDMVLYSENSWTEDESADESRRHMRVTLSSLCEVEEFLRITGETIHIGDDIEVTVLYVTGNQIRIGIDTPHETPVHREEVYQRIRKELEPA